METSEKIGTCSKVCINKHFMLVSSSSEKGSSNVRKRATPKYQVIFIFAPKFVFLCMEVPFYSNCFPKLNCMNV